MTYLCICARQCSACWLLSHSKERSRLCSLTDVSQACWERKPETEKPDQALDNQLQEARRQAEEQATHQRPGQQSVGTPACS